MRTKIFVAIILLICMTLSLTSCFIVINHEEVRKMQIIIKDLVSLTPTKTLLSDQAVLTSSILSKTSGPGIRDRK